MKSSPSSLTHATSVFYEATYLPPIIRAENQEALPLPSPFVATSGHYKSCKFTLLMFLQSAPYFQIYSHCADPDHY